MEKSEFIKYLATKHQRSQTYYAQALKDITEGLTVQLAKGKAVRLTGFGTFYTIQVQAQQGRNPRTGEAIALPAHRRAGFRVGALLRRAVQSKRS